MGKVRTKIKKVFGVGVNDADYAVQRYERVNGKSKQVWICPYYVVWKHMLERCYDKKCLLNHPTYSDCILFEGWIYFMTFKAWMTTQDFEGKQLDKDILFEGNKVYSPETCRFVDSKVNSFITDSKAARGKWPIGVYWNKDSSKFRAMCQNPFTKKKEHLGLFHCPDEAHLAWRKRKHELACMWADLQDDPLIAEALRKRFAPKGGSV
jgi:hypothetical protein